MTFDGGQGHRGQGQNYIKCTFLQADSIVLYIHHPIIMGCRSDVHMLIVEVTFDKGQGHQGQARDLRAMNNNTHYWALLVRGPS